MISALIKLFKSSFFIQSQDQILKIFGSQYYFIVEAKHRQSQHHCIVKYLKMIWSWSRWSVTWYWVIAAPGPGCHSCYHHYNNPINFWIPSSNIISVSVSLQILSSSSSSGQAPTLGFLKMINEILPLASHCFHPLETTVGAWCLQSSAQN